MKVTIDLTYKEVRFIKKSNRFHLRKLKKYKSGDMKTHTETALRIIQKLLKTKDGRHL